MRILHIFQLHAHRYQGLCTPICTFQVALLRETCEQTCADRARGWDDCVTAVDASEAKVAAREVGRRVMQQKVGK